MKIHEKDDYIDFEAPVFMGDKQRKFFISSLKTLFPSLKIKHVKEKTKEMGERDITIKKWNPKEYALLLGPEDNGSLANKTGRSRMSILMQRGSFVPEFLAWLKKKGKDYTRAPEVIKEFLMETKREWKS